MIKKSELTIRLEAILDQLADIEHQRWSHWQQYMHNKGQRLPDGSLLFPSKLVAHWEHQINTPFQQLTEHEKESDREQVRKYLPVIFNALSR